MKKSIILASIILLISSMFVVSCSQPQQNKAPSIVGTWNRAVNNEAAPAKLIFYDSGSFTGFDDEENIYWTGTYAILGSGSISMKINVSDGSEISGTGTFTSGSLTLRFMTYSATYTR